MKTQRSREGYLLIDHRASPGIDPALGRAWGAPAVPEGQLLEAPTFTCSHCGGVVVMNPNRIRERAYCRSCDRRICDSCGAIAAQTGACQPLARALDARQEAHLTSQPLGGLTHG